MSGWWRDRHVPHGPSIHGSGAEQVPTRNDERTGGFPVLVHAVLLYACTYIHTYARTRTWEVRLTQMVVGCDGRVSYQHRRRISFRFQSHGDTRIGTSHLAWLVPSFSISRVDLTAFLPFCLCPFLSSQCLPLPIAFLPFCQPRPASNDLGEGLIMHTPAVKLILQFA
jgi:hypothetical protein